MPRIPRNLIKEKNRCYHIISETTGQQFLLGDLEKEYLMERIKMLSSVYFAKVFTFAVLSNHFHLIAQVQDGEKYSDEEIERRYYRRYGTKKPFPKERIGYYRERWSDLSEYAKEVKQGFSCWYNKLNKRRGFFWGGRFNCVVVEPGPALLSFMAYVDLNAVRANIVDRPEDYRYCGLGYHIQSGNQDSFLNLDLSELVVGQESPLIAYRKYVYEVGSLERSDGKRRIPISISEQEADSDYRLKRTALFRYRSRYFTESVVLGSRIFVKEVYARLQPYLRTREDREPVRIHGAEGLYSMRRLK